MKLQGEKGSLSYQLLQQQQGAICIKIKKINNFFINNNYKAQQLNFLIIYLNHNKYLSNNSMNELLNLEKERQKRVTKVPKDVTKGGIPWHQGCFSDGSVFF